MRSEQAKLGLLAAILIAGLGLARGETVHKAKRSTPARPSHAAPDVTSTIAKPTPPAEPAPLVDDRTIPPPFVLPTATRSLVRACGAAWRDMKLAGKTGDEDWRDFAVHCLAGKGPVPVDDRARAD